LDIKNDGRKVYDQFHLVTGHSGCIARTGAGGTTSQDNHCYK
jgi:hypothetical protein